MLMPRWTRRFMWGLNAPEAARPIRLQLNLWTAGVVGHLHVANEGDARATDRGFAATEGADITTNNEPEPARERASLAPSQEFHRIHS